MSKDRPVERKPTRIPNIVCLASVLPILRYKDNVIPAISKAIDVKGNVLSWAIKKKLASRTPIVVVLKLIFRKKLIINRMDKVRQITTKEYNNWTCIISGTNNFNSKKLTITIIK